MSDRDELIDKFHLAVVCLASGPGSVQARLADAYEGALAAVSNADLPPDLADEFASVRDEILTHAAGRSPEGERLTDEAARGLARRIVALYEQVRREELEAV